MDILSKGQKPQHEGGGAYIALPMHLRVNRIVMYTSLVRNAAVETSLFGNIGSTWFCNSIRAEILKLKNH